MQVSLSGKLCIADQQATVGIVPEGKVVTTASLGVPLVIVEAGVSVIGTIMDTTLPPQLTVTVASGGRVRACVDCSLSIRPLAVAVTAYYTTFTCLSWFEVCFTFFCIKLPWIDWCPHTNYVLVDFKTATIVVPLFSFCLGPKIVELPVPPPSIRLQQVRVPCSCHVSELVVKLRVGAS